MTATTIPQNLDVLGCPLDGMTLIEASAGTGKTWNICMLYLRLLLEKKLAVPQILVVTFTNAATAELKERIRTRLGEMLLLVETKQETEQETDPLGELLTRLEQSGITREEIKQSIRTALASFDEAMILTIHGFCRKIATALAFETGQPFAFEVSPEEQETLRQVVEDFWRKHIAADTLDKTLARYLHAKNITPETLCEFLKREISRPLAKKRCPPDIAPMNQQALSQLRKAYDDMAKMWPLCRETVYTQITHAQEEKTIGSAYKAENLRPILAAYDKLFQNNDPDIFLLEKNTLDQLCKLTPQKLEKAILKPARDKGKTAPTHPFFDCAQAWMEKRGAMETMLEHACLHLLARLAEEAEEVRRRRQANRLLSPDDMLYCLYDALRKSDTLPQKIRELCPAALVDEFQDTDPLQLFIFRKIYAGSGHPLFLVGDPKQAIYRFRNADLHTYLAAKEEVKKKEEKKEGKLYALKTNQRSTPEMVAACNALFSRNPNAFMLEGMNYLPSSSGERKREALQDNSTSGTPAKNGMIIWQLPHTDETRLMRAEAIQKSASATAAEIARLLAAGKAGLITIGNTPLQASDIAVLVRTHKESGIMQQALAALGLPSVSLSQGSVWDSPEAEELALILAAAAQPRRQTYLKAALATEMLGLDAAAIEEITHSDTKQLAWLEKFMAYQADWLKRGAGFAIRQILAKHNIPAKLLALPDGERRLTNLLHLAELIHEAGQSYPLPESLLKWINKQRDTASSEQTQLRLESDEQLIRIMTIHASKGLEFPFVFCPFLWDAFSRNQDKKLPGLVYQEGEQLIMDFRKHEQKEDAIKSAIQVEEAAERIRLIYVAITRAIYRCYLVAGCYLQPTRGAPSIKPTTRGVLNWLVGSDGIYPNAWLKEGDEKRVNAIEAGWQSLAGSKGITLTALPEKDGNTPELPPDEDPLPALQAAPLPNRIASGWRIGSYSTLVYNATQETPGSDRDERTSGKSPEEETPITLPPDDILRFPASRYAGNCLHAVFEKADFTDESTWEKAISQALLHHPPYGETPAREREQPQTLSAMIRRMLRQVLATPLHDGLRLETVSMKHRLTELEFFLPVKHLPKEALNAIMDETNPGSRLDFPPLEGYVKGMMDLLVKHNNRFYLLDWKSNFLGLAPADYTGTALDKAMSQHHYHLQHLLYTVALNRYLSQRLPGYTYEQHFGGVLYLFVRGVRPEWKTAEGRPCGVFFHRAEEETIRRLDTLLYKGTLS